ncbi:branched-chain amino acid transport system II carrier protein [Staphylococcus saprophyticus]|uniref:branched-chain amino acid transport system II carrier protein n=1 Tax=Staphylococcus saprophyticus TaxID=29385 RepID=UPI001642B38C|nr:branched-chain amino acid transport system II carrier protein [Staphylococcus saprophyticus]MBC2920483.1 branched-chain amino acid transport system II carrier protein [Staphylococcus saprophyticus]MBC2958080.1 branched-chain amino acid transport system II carrier protein [Staphylococcus saprophyticus]MBC3008105.1 branched-chain amino acid transport system II carrier protein [Staphylococcus saprophyticus]MBC3022803.1 branched-chain amino acid transport system II carrier protein [Staphylococcu
MNKLILISGLMLFSFFFGAGNLIFPPMLGYTAQENMWVSMTGFAITGILLPYITVIVVAYMNGGVESIGNKVHPIFGTVFAICIYLSIGALYGIPRAANVAYEIGTNHVLPVHNHFTLIIFSLIFFLVVYLIALYPNRIIDNLGKYLTPILIIIIAVLCILVIINPEGSIGQASGEYAQTPIVSGILEGYFTMDLVAALAFSVVIVQMFKMSGVNDHKTLVKNVIKSGLISAILLLIIYFALAYAGATTSHEGFKDGTGILTFNSLRVFGSIGNLLFGVIVILACLTTCIGLVNACAAFAMKKLPKISYKMFVLIFSLLGFLVSTLGLELILQIAVPLLTFIYPTSIVLVLISLVSIFIPFEMKYAFILPTLMTLFISLLQIFNDFNLFQPLISLYKVLPLSDIQLSWLLPFIILLFIGLIIDYFLKNKTVSTS